MDGDAAKHDWRRICLDAVMGCLLLAMLVGVYVWDQSAEPTQSVAAATPSRPLDSQTAGADIAPASKPVAAATTTPVVETSNINTPTSVQTPEKPRTTHDTAASSATAETAAPKGKFLLADAFVPNREKIRSELPSNVPDKPKAPESVLETLLTQSNIDKFGNLEGDSLGLSENGEFRGARILVWTPEPEVQSNIFTSDNPLWVALKDKGFEVDLEFGPFQTSSLERANQLWCFAGQSKGLDSAAEDAIVAFVEAGKGLYLAADNEPYLQDAAQLARRIFDVEVTGNFLGGNVIAVRGHGVTRDDYEQHAAEGRTLSPATRPGQKTASEQRAEDASARLAIIRRATHYAEEHPLLTDVNFIFEGATISHISPSSRLETVLTAFDKQILAAVSVNPQQRVVVDCGWTRYYHSPQGRYTTETAGTLRYAENIAAYLMGKDSKRSSWKRWRERQRMIEEYATADEAEVLKAFEDPSPERREAAILSATERKLPCRDALIERLLDVEAHVRWQSRLALRKLFDGRDFGPAENAPPAEWIATHRAWTAWVVQQALLEQYTPKSDAEILAAFTHAEPSHRWAAVTLATQRRLDVPEMLIKLLSDDEAEVAQQARYALARLAGGKDFGPQRNADLAGQAKAVLEWNRWRVARRFPEIVQSPPEELAVTVRSPEAEERWAAAIAIRQRKLKMAPELISLLGDPQADIGQEARAGLVELASNQNFGPEPGASAEDIAKAMQAWTAWWHEESEKAGKAMLNLAKTLLAKNPAAARRRLEEIIRQFPGSDTAAEAQRLLDQSP